MARRYSMGEFARFGYLTSKGYSKNEAFKILDKEKQIRLKTRKKRKPTPFGIRMPRF